jgi:hypothetical protein
MGLAQLSSQERELIKRCLRAAVEGPFFPNVEFHTLFGIERMEVAAVLAKWPEVDESAEHVNLAINNSLGNLLGYPHDKYAAFKEFVGETFEEIERVFHKWRGERDSSDM